LYPHQYLDNRVFDAARWQKATASEPYRACVELAKVGGVVAVRDSKLSDGPLLQFRAEEISTFVSRVKSGTFDRSA
jgi:hypothetical protein